MFYIDGTIHKLEGNRIAISEDGKIETVDNALKNNIRLSSVSDTGVEVFEYFSSSSIVQSNANCGKSKIEDRIRNDAKDRDIAFEIQTGIHLYSGTVNSRQYFAEAKITNYKKKAIGSSFTTYNTTCEMKNVIFTVSVPIVTGYTGGKSIFVYSDRTYSWSHMVCNQEVARYTVWSLYGDVVQNVTDLQSPTFNRIQGQASNRGMGTNKWITLSCGW